MISVDGVTVEFNGAALFSNIAFNINENDRIALIPSVGQMWQRVPILF
jgi:ATP-binding cassette subfamily F protein 3